MFEILAESESSDVESFCETVRSWKLDLRPLTSLGATGLDNRVRQVRCGPLEFGYARFRISIEQFGAPPTGAYTFVVPGKRLCRLWWRGHDIGPNTILVFPVGSELHSMSGPDFEIYTVTLTESLVWEICEELGLTMPASRLRPEVFNAETAILRELQLNLYGLKQRAASDFLLDSQRVAELLVTTWLGREHPRKLTGLNGRRNGLAMGACLSIIENEHCLAVTPALLCERAGVSKRTLEYAFRRRFGITPAAFLKARRLAAVRRKLLDPRQKNPVIGEIAGEFGFLHIGQFAADYRRAFGELPSSTLKLQKEGQRGA